MAVTREEQPAVFIEDLFAPTTSVGFQSLLEQSDEYEFQQSVSATSTASTATSYNAGDYLLGYVDNSGTKVTSYENRVYMPRRGLFGECATQLPLTFMENTESESCTQFVVSSSRAVTV